MMGSKWFQLLLVALLLILLLVENLPRFLTGYAQWLEVDNARQGADAIVILGGSPINRVPAAIDRYEAGYAPLILVTQVREPADRYSEFLRIERHRITDLLDHLEVAYEVVPSDKGGATSTLDEAWDVARWVRDREGIERVILVTDGFHTRRSLYAFEKIAAHKGVAVAYEAAAAPTERYTHENWWRTEAGISHYVLEGIKWLLYPFVHENVEFIEESP